MSGSIGGRRYWEGGINWFIAYIITLIKITPPLLQRVVPLYNPSLGIGSLCESVAELDDLDKSEFVMR